MKLEVTPPRDYVLARDACSYGYFLLEPNRWEPRTATFITSLHVDGLGVSVRVRQPGCEPARPALGAGRGAWSGAGARLVLSVDRALGTDGRAPLKAMLTRMLRLDEPAAVIEEFHALDPRFGPSGRGRLMRSPSLFEDVIKTVTSCNVAWPSTITMNARLCQEYGEKTASGLHAFPTPERIARLHPAGLRTRARVGYRDARIIELARMFVRGAIDPRWFEHPGTSDEALLEALVELPGIGPYAAANIMQLLGRYSRLPLDTESVRHGRDVLGFTGTSAEIMRRVQEHFEPMARHRFRSYWFELWDFYERKRGASWTWDRETTGKTFTAARLNDADFAGEQPGVEPVLTREPGGGRGGYRGPGGSSHVAKARGTGARRAGGARAGG